MTFAVGDPVSDGAVTTWPVESDALSAPATIRILEPDPLPTSPRVLFALPVSDDIERYGDGLAEIQAAGLHDRHGLVVVAPSMPDRPWWADHATDPARQHETYMLAGIVPWLDGLYPATTSRLLCGFSRTGHGALSLLLRHPDLFAAAACYDAPLYVTDLSRFFMADVFGTWENYLNYRFDELVEGRAAERDQIRIVLLGHFLFATHMQTARRRMISLHLDCPYHDAPRPEHSWRGGWTLEAVEALVSLPV